MGGRGPNVSLHQAMNPGLLHPHSVRSGANGYTETLRHASVVYSTSLGQVVIGCTSRPASPPWRAFAVRHDRAPSNAQRCWRGTRCAGRRGPANVHAPAKHPPSLRRRRPNDGGSDIWDEKHEGPAYHAMEVPPTTSIMIAVAQNLRRRSHVGSTPTLRFSSGAATPMQASRHRQHWLGVGQFAACVAVGILRTLQYRAPAS